MKESINTITLEDGIVYAVIEEIESKDTRYVFLSNIDDNEDFCIRKVIKEDNEEILVGLDNDEEFDLALMLFSKNHKEELEQL